MSGKPELRPSPASMMLPPWSHPMMYPYMGPHPLDVYNSAQSQGQGRVITPSMSMQGQAAARQPCLSPKISLDVSN